MATFVFAGCRRPMAKKSTITFHVSVKHCLNKNNVELMQPQVGISSTDAHVDHNLEPITSA